MLKYHIILVCKYRKKLLTHLIEKNMKRIVNDIAEASNFTIEVMETDKDHLHLLISSEPKFSPLSIVHRLKSISTYRIWKKHELFLKKHFWKERTFWTDGYFVASCGNVCAETIRKYIEEQG